MNELVRLMTNPEALPEAVRGERTSIGWNAEVKTLQTLPVAPNDPRSNIEGHLAVADAYLLRDRYSRGAGAPNGRHQWNESLVGSSRRIRPWSCGMSAQLSATMAGPPRTKNLVGVSFVFGV